MKKITLVLLSFSLMISFSSAVASQGKASEKEAISLREISPFTYCCIPHKGPFTEIQEVIGGLVQAIRGQNISPTGPLVGIYYNSPAEVKETELEWEVGFPVMPQAAAQAPLEIKQWNFTTVASALHTGPYETTEQTISKILEWMKSNGYTQAGPIMERYMDMDPSAVKPEELRTEIWIPCQKS
jgi:effector-binding domain-containing protein